MSIAKSGDFVAGLRWMVTGLLLLSASSAWGAAPARDRQPNIVLIYADDLGYGDLSCYGATRVSTPHIDRLAAQGLRFTDGYAGSGTCTPSRYALLTGEYAFRRPGTNILPGDAALIIEPGRLTVATLLQRAGYATAVIGKWHLGLGRGRESLDWNRPIAPGPRDVGFEYSFILPATGDRVPCVYVENHRVVGLDPDDPIRVSYQTPFPGEPTGVTHRQQLKMDWSFGHNQAIVNGIGRNGHMIGGQRARWVDEDMSDVLAEKAVKFIEREGATSRPFFLFFAAHDPHVPRVPHPRFVGRTPMGPRGDVIVQLDDAVGQIVSAIERLGLAEKTLILVTSDNGPVLDNGYRDGAVEQLGDHRPAGPLRGGKSSMYEGGSRVPWVVSWPGRIPAGRTSDALVSQIDLLASLAALVQHPLNPTESGDSVNVLPALLGDARTARTELVLQGGRRALRSGPWKFIPAGGGPARHANSGVETGNAPEPQLFNLASDPGERTNLAASEPERVAAMAARLEALTAAR